LNIRIENSLEEIISGRSILLRPFLLYHFPATLQFACLCIGFAFVAHGIFLVVKKIILPEKACHEKDFLKY